MGNDALRSIIICRVAIRNNIFESFLLSVDVHLRHRQKAAKINEIFWYLVVCSQTHKTVEIEVAALRHLSSTRLLDTLPTLKSQLQIHQTSVIGHSNMQSLKDYH